MFPSDTFYGNPGIGGAEYYDRLRLEDEFRVHGEKHVFNSEVNRRFNRHMIEKETKINERRQRLLKQLQCEALRDQDLCKQKLEQEKTSRKLALFEEADRLNKQLKEKETQIAEEKYTQRCFQNNALIREHLHRLHAEEIAKDRAYLAQQREQNRLEEKRLNDLLGTEPTFFNEQLDREAEERKKIREEHQELSRSYLEESEHKKSRALQDKQKQIEENKIMLGNIEKEMEQPMKTIEKQKAEKEQQKKLQEDMIEARRQRDAAKCMESLLGTYCNPPLTPTDSVKQTMERETMRKEQLQFIDYQKRASQEEEGYEKHIDKLYADIAEEKYFKEQERKKKEFARMREVAEETAARQREAVARILEAEQARRGKVKEEGRQMQEKHQKYLKTLELDKQKKYEQSKAFAEEVRCQKELSDRLRHLMREQEREREREAVFQAEGEYQRRVKQVLAENPLANYLHPWRKAAMANNR
ncbi:uncharacterized protein DEA37_0012442 [Paragonimus westermani]|uniref:Trichohyalin-plectin-homology domain-containing protein n=1 Tax=Paragonimus westermani TaxID=34504 RepID=A0A5J4NE09_9TREM|nr:uncharacterized protein DEA37_0012442 [Paragonimus westermani]